MSSDKNTIDEMLSGQSKDKVQEKNVKTGNDPYNSTKFKIYKTIYAKRKGHFSNEMLSKILVLEANTHLDKHPDLVYAGMGESIKNDDRSITYQLIFAPKPKDADPLNPVSHEQSK